MILLTASIYSIICFILIQIIFVHTKIVSNDFLEVSYNATNSAKLWPSGTGRSARSIYETLPQILETAIQYEAEPIIRATLTKQQPNLANKYLPVISSQMIPFRNVMNDVGEFVMYQDFENCIAVVYFKKLGTFHGVIGLNHYIVDFPLNLDAGGNHRLELIGKPYVRNNQHKFFHINPNDNYPSPSDIDAWEEFLRPFNYPWTGMPREDTLELQPSIGIQLSEENNRTYYGSASHTSKKKPISHGPWNLYQYYVETLVIVTYDLADIFKANHGEKEYVAAIVRYHITYFNAVNMLLKKLSQMKNDYFEVIINIAKIVIANNSTSFDFEDGNELHFTDVTMKLPQFFSNHSNFYTEDSFDYVFVHTSRLIMDENTLVNAISKYGQNMIEGRKNGKFYETIPITVAKFKKFYAHYAIAAHEIGRILGLKITPKENGSQLSRQCHSIMQRGGPKCNNCLAWTVDNIHQILRFFSENVNRCIFLNKPRSLHPSVPMRMVSPYKQCKCMGYKSNDKLHKSKVYPYVLHDDCSLPLRCHNEHGHQIFVEYTIRPFDGTPCGNRKVCWNGKCQRIGKNLTK